MKDNIKPQQYTDISSNEDSKLRIIANLLMQSESFLEVKDTKELGHYINDYLDKKCLIDHFFWNRSLISCKFSEVEIKSMLLMFESMYK